MENLELLESEYFIPLKNFEKTYLISNFGRLYSNYQKKLMSFREKKDYYTLAMENRKNKRFHVYDLMASNFSEEIVQFYKTYINKDKIESFSDEIWKDVVGFERYYQCSNMGRIKALPRKTRTWEIHKESITIGGTTRGYRKFPAHKENKKYNLLAHRVIAEAFISNPNNYPYINHINAIRNDNRIENLEWCTHSMNIKHAYKLGNKNQKGEKNNSAKINQEIANNIRIYYEQNKHLSQREIGLVFNLSRENIKDIINYKTWNY